MVFACVHDAGRAQMAAAIFNLLAHPEKAAAVSALYRYLHPVRGGPDGTGWPFGRAVVAGELHSVLQRLPDVDFVEQIRLHPANPVDRTRGAQVERLPLGPNNLVFSWGHRVVVEGQ